jgi:hypothetical protein
MAIPRQTLSIAKHQQFGKQCHPGKYLNVFQSLPAQPRAIQTIINGCFIHPWDHLLSGRPIPPQRQHEMHLRTVPSLIEHCLAICPAPLTQARPYHQRLMVTCRDFALAICSIMKSQGFAARCRYAFNVYIWPAFYHDQIIVEYWSPRRNGWCRLDPRTAPHELEHKSQCKGLQVDHMNHMHCPLAAEVWLACRKKQADPSQFGAGLCKKHHGMAYIRNALIHDLAMINHHVGLLWDLWGDMTQSINHENVHEYDQLALALCQGCPTQLSIWYNKKQYHPHGNNYHSQTKPCQLFP